MKSESPIIDDIKSYAKAEIEASQYFAALQSFLHQQTYMDPLVTHFRKWEADHKWRQPLFERLFRNWVRPQSDQVYMYKLEKQGKLEAYLERSVAYLYMRDLGKNMDEASTWTSIRRTVKQLKPKWMLQVQEQNQLDFNETDFFRWAEKHDVAETAIWLMERLQLVAAHIPEGMDAAHAQRKLIKIIIGVVMHALDEIAVSEEQLDKQEQASRIDKALRLGYCYGLTYPYIDDLLDAPSFSAAEKQQYALMIRQTLLTGNVPIEQQWYGANASHLQFIQQELRQAFLYLHQHIPEEKRLSFFEQAYVFFHAQELDREKSLDNPHYTNEQLMYPIIIKSSSSRLLARSIIQQEEEAGFAERTFYYGLFNQLADDFADLLEDQRRGAVTPYTYYLAYQQRRFDLINPFELYWVVIYYLANVIYQKNEQVQNLLLSRAINGLKRYRQRLGDQAYEQLITQLTVHNDTLRSWVMRIEKKAVDVSFVDKWVRDRYVKQFQHTKQLENAFQQKIELARAHINNSLQVEVTNPATDMEQLLADAANYSLESGGKRLRPLLTWIVAVDYYQLDVATITPLLQSLEYMHTASLVFDDLPSQDNASLRRGKQTLHVVHNSAIAELTGLFLVQKAIQAQALLRHSNQFAERDIIALMEYAAQQAEQLCIGQAMDLEARGKRLTSEQLDEICYYKTGAAFEAAIIMPAILAQASIQEIEKWKRFAYYAGIAFQIKDDLLDVEGEVTTIGKPVGQDHTNDTSNYVAVFGITGAKVALWQHYSSAVEILTTLERPAPFIQLILQYMMQRNK